jgi:glucokinase
MGFLAIDVGGTKTEIAYLENLDTFQILIQKRYESKLYESLEAIIEDFISLHQLKVKQIGIGIAGAVVEGVCHTTNLPWIVDAHKLIHQFHLENCKMMNDLVANAYGIQVLKDEDKVVLQKGISKLKGNQALISAGTGLGEAGLFFDGKSYHPFPTEGGHCDFAPTDEEEIEILKFLQKRHGHVSYERILSGMGFSALYDFYTSEQKMPKSQAVELITDKKQRPKIITDLGLKKQDKTCETVLRRFVKIYAQEASNLALKLYALGGLYIGGGIAPKIIEAMMTPDFLSTFKDKGRFHDWLNFVTIVLIKDEKTALKGAAFAIKSN